MSTESGEILKISTKKITRRSASFRVVDAADNPHSAVSPLLARILAVRGVNALQQHHSLKNLAPPHLLKGGLPAASLLADALAARHRILFVGDFDADGATSTALGIEALRAFGAEAVDYLVPNRFDFGYGLTPEIVELAADFEPQVLITVDNGISSHEGVRVAKNMGWQVVITDHHLPGRELPDADVIVNPNQPDCQFPSKAIAGVGVVFYLMMLLRAELRKRGWFAAQKKAEPNLGQFLDLVALGTVADVVPLDENNRILVEQGIRRIRCGSVRPGIAAILAVAGRDPAKLVAADLGFAVGPRLNAAGRLEDMSFGIECLLADNDSALQMAERLDALNQQRKAIEQEMHGDAQFFMEKLQTPDAGLPAGLCLYDKSWHQGVIGILASRVKERYHRPVIAFANAGDGMLKGSARSIPGLHIRDCLDAVAKQHPDLLAKFGGHAMAAGLSLQHKDFDRFCLAFQDQAALSLSQQALAAEIVTDGELAAEDFNLGCAEELRYAAPWGQAFPEPSFDGLFGLDKIRVVGKRHLKMTLQDLRTGMHYEAIQFNADTALPFQCWRHVHVVYRLDINEYMGRQSLQLLIDHLEPQD